MVKMDTRDIKEILQELWSTHPTIIALGVCFILWSGWMGAYASCNMPLDDGITYVYGNCGELANYQIKKENKIDYTKFVINMTQTKVNYSYITTTTTIPCPPPSICPECSVCPVCSCTCPVCTTTACPKIDYQIVLDEVNRWRPDMEAPAVQHGWFRFRDQLRVYLGGTASKFREGPSINYKPITSKEEDVFQIVKDEFNCFTLEQYPDLNGRKRWNWNKNDCMTSNITICHL